MPRLKSQAAKDSLLRRVRRQRLKYITVLPSLVTILNGVCGFAAIVLAGRGEYAKSGYLMLVAMGADMLDGRLARMSHSTSSFGGQLDSLCDVISFGIAPAFLMFRVLEHELALAEMEFLERFIWLAAGVYISCSAIRLARFNVENEEDESAHMSFIGLPTPAAAGVIVSLVIFHEEILTKLLTSGSSAYPLCRGVIMYSLPFLVLGVAVLMVSRIRYPHILNQYIKGKKPLDHFIRVVFLIAIIVWSRQVAFVLIFCGFALSGFSKWFYYKVLKKKRVVAPDDQPAFAAAGPVEISDEDAEV